MISFLFFTFSEVVLSTAMLLIQIVTEPESQTLVCHVAWCKSHAHCCIVSQGQREASSNFGVAPLASCAICSRCP